MKPQVLFSDNHVLAVDKPALLVTQPTEGHVTSLEEWAKAWVKESMQKSGAVFLHAIHRLDREVGGIVLFARTSKALTRLNEAMRKKQIVKTYHALVEGYIKESEGRLCHHLEHKEHRAEISSGPESKEAILRYHVLERKKDTTLVEIQLETGRYHQIRAQFAAIGHPIIGDRKYGSKTLYFQAGIALCHAEISFPHPVLKNTIEIQSKVSFCL